MYLFGHVFVAVCELSLVVASGATPCCHVWASHFADFSSFRPPALGTQASVVVAHGHSCPVASPQTIDRTPCPLYWQVDSLPLYNQGSPPTVYFCTAKVCGGPCPHSQKLDICTYSANSHFCMPVLEVGTRLFTLSLSRMTTDCSGVLKKWENV